MNPYVFIVGCPRSGTTLLRRIGNAHPELEGRTRSKPGLSAKTSWQPVTAGLRSWREQMASGDVARFEAAADEFLDELEYTRGAAVGSPKELARAARLRASFADDARSRRLAIPESWEGLAA